MTGEVKRLSVWNRFHSSDILKIDNFCEHVELSSERFGGKVAKSKGKPYHKAVTIIIIINREATVLEIREKSEKVKKGWNGLRNVKEFGKEEESPGI